MNPDPDFRDAARRLKQRADFPRTCTSIYKPAPFWQRTQVAHVAPEVLNSSQRRAREAGAGD